MIDDVEACHRAVSSRDARFDGRFVVAVTSTGIYCRPSCPARTPHRRNRRFFATSAAAQRHGFRSCKRCRPDATPGSPEWDLRSDVVGRAMRLIADGCVDREGVPGLAQRVGYSARQLQRVLLAELGAGPLALARAQRAQTARVLIETTDLPFSDVAFAAGFGSIRQFNDTVRDVFARSPGELRLAAGRPAGSVSRPQGPAGLALRLPFRPPITATATFGHLVATAVPGLEHWDGERYHRSLDLPHGGGVASLAPPAPDATWVAAELQLDDLRDLAAAVDRCRQLLDLDADPVAVDEVLATDPGLAGAVAAAPGRRVPRAVDGFELAVRVVIGQQVSTAAARTHTARLVAAAGSPLARPLGPVQRRFPGPEAVAGWAEEAPGLTGARRRTLAALASAVRVGDLDLSAGADRTAALATLADLPGVGPWTVAMVAMRALGDPDALPSGDLGVRRGAAVLGLGDRTGDRPTRPGPAGPAQVGAGELDRRSRRWRPWRAYATQHLWAATPHDINRLPEAAGPVSAGAAPACPAPGHRPDPAASARRRRDRRPRPTRRPEEPS